MDDIISLYLKPKEGEKAKSSSAAITSPQNDDIIKKYLKKPTAVTSSEPSVPVSALGPEGGSGGTEHGLPEYESTSLSDVGKNAALRGANAVKEGAFTAASGLGNIFSSKSASGVGKVGLGALQILGSPADVISSVGSDITGSKEAGDRLGFIAGALPVSKIAKAYSPVGLPFRLPTVDNLSPVKNPFGYPNVVKDKALNTIVNNLTSGGMDHSGLVDTINKIKADSRIGPVDTNPNVKSLIQDIYAKDNPAAKSYLFNTSKGRVASLPEDVSTAFSDAGGVPVNVVQKLNDLSEASKKVGNELIQPALAKAKPVDISNTLESIDNILKPGVLKIGKSVPLTEVKNQLADINKSLTTSKEYDANDLHQFQSSLRSTAQSLIRKGGTEGQVGYALMNVRNNIVSDIDKAAPGYKEGLSAYKDTKQISDTFIKGYDSALPTSKAIEDRPEFTKQWFNGLSDHEKEAAREGIMLRYDTEMKAAKNPSLAGTNMGKSDFNQQIMEMALGKDKTQKLLQDLENTRAIKDTDNKVIEGSQTAMRLSNKKDTALSKDQPKEEGLAKYIYPSMAAAGEYATGATGLASIGVAGLAGAMKVGSVAKNKITNLMEQERNLHLAKMALPVEGPDRAKLISDLEKFLPQPKQSLLSRVASKLPISP
jgi:hypothetical protein